MRLKTAPDDSQDEWVKKLYTEVTRPPLFRPGAAPGPIEGDPFPAPPRLGGAPDIIRTFSLRPDAGYHFFEAVHRAHFDTDGHLPADAKQMIATYVAALRSCVY